jgi:hypothetical protein
VTGEPHPAASTPLLAPHQAAVLLDEVIYEQVLACIDLEALYQLEQSLTMTVADFEGAGDRAADLASALVDRALLRLPDDVRRYLHAFGHPPFAGCELCDEAEADRAGRLAAAGPRRSTRSDADPRRASAPAPAPHQLGGLWKVPLASVSASGNKLAEIAPNRTGL